MSEACVAGMINAGKTINGWKPPIMPGHYDAGVGDARIATQADIDQLLAVKAAHGRVMQFVRSIMREHEDLLARLGQP